MTAEIDYVRTEGDITVRRYKDGNYEIESPVLECPWAYKIQHWNAYHLVEKGSLYDIYLDLYRACYAIFVYDSLIESSLYTIDNARKFIQGHKFPEPLANPCSFASFKRDASFPGFTMTSTFRGVEVTRKILKIQSNALVLSTPNKPSGESWLFFPPASLVEYNKEKLRIYQPASRFYNQKEIEASLLWESKRNPLAYEIGGNMEFHREEDFWKERKMLYMFSHKYINGMMRNYNNNLISDSHIKGKLSLEYEVHLS